MVPRDDGYAYANVDWTGFRYRDDTYDNKSDEVGIFLVERYGRRIYDIVCSGWTPFGKAKRRTLVEVYDERVNRAMVTRI